MTRGSMQTRMRFLNVVVFDVDHFRCGWVLMLVVSNDGVCTCDARVFDVCAFCGGGIWHFDVVVALGNFAAVGCSLHLFVIVIELFSRFLMGGNISFFCSLLVAEFVVVIAVVFFSTKICFQIHAFRLMCALSC